MLPPVSLPVGHDTVYLTTADAQGMMMSFIQSNFRAFGSGIVIPGTGIAMQNRGSGFSLDPEHPNCVAPGKRPFHTIIPGFVTQGGEPVLSFGVMGGHMQHQGHVQMVSRLFDYGQNPQEASDAPRWHVYPDLTVGLEKGMPQSLFDGLKERGNPGRHEPDIGEINYPFLFNLIDDLGYDGWVGCEYKPKAGTESGLGWLKRP